MNSLLLKGLSHSYGSVQSLHSIDLACPASGITCLLGPSGCGKSTLLRCVAGHETPTAGSIHLGDQVLVDSNTFISPEKRKIGMVFQDYALFPHLKIWQNVAFGLQDLPRKERRTRAHEVLEQMEIGELADRYPHTCSGGQQQRVALARALAPRPHALLLDEPFSGLDSGLRDTLRHEIRELLLRENLPTLLVTHDPDEALCCADQIVLLQEGRLAQIGSPDAIWNKPATVDVMAFFSSILPFDVEIKDHFCHSPFGMLHLEVPDGPYTLAVRTEAITPHPDGEFSFPILSQNACGGHQHINVKLPDGQNARFQIPQGQVTSETRYRLDPSQVKAFPRNR